MEESSTTYSSDIGPSESENSSFSSNPQDASTNAGSGKFYFAHQNSLLLRNRNPFDAFQFLSLPGELRNAVFESITTLNVDHGVTRYIWKDEWRLRIEPGWIESNDYRSAIQLVRTCSQLYGELTPLVYQMVDGEFWFYDTESSVKFMKTVGPCGRFVKTIKILDDWFTSDAVENVAFEMLCDVIRSLSEELRHVKFSALGWDDWAFDWLLGEPLGSQWRGRVMELYLKGLSRLDVHDSIREFLKGLQRFVEEAEVLSAADVRVEVEQLTVNEAYGGSEMNSQSVHASNLMCNCEG